MRHAGVVKFFRKDKGYGFIIPDGDEMQDVFVHYSDIDQEGYRNLFQDDRVTFDLVPNGRKGLKAEKVRLQVGG